MSELPDITILVPVWKRPEFLPLLIMNLKSQNYPHEHLRLIIDDDTENSDERFITNLQEVKQLLHPIKVEYITGKPRRSIGKKRNDLVKACKTKIFMFFDSDEMLSLEMISSRISNFLEVSSFFVLLFRRFSFLIIRHIY